MSVAVTDAPGAVVASRTAATPVVVPWYLWAVSFASTSVIVGAMWDISWHRTIGRDSFWTPAHLAIYLGGALAGLACGWHVLRTTFGPDADARSATVRFWGFRGPLGAWVCIWGALAMIVSAPFDDWWHNAYGLDVEVLSPPHVVLATGIFAIGIGAMLTALARQNVAPAEDRRLSWLFAYAAGLAMLQVATLFMERIAFPNTQHSPQFFFVCAVIVPLVLIGVSRGSHSRWGATSAAAIYMGITLAMVWILPLFPARPMLAPILRQVDHMVPPPFPILLVAPAIAIDLVLRTLPDVAGRWRQVCTAAVAGVAAMLLLVAVQWPFAQFLLAEPARNAFFAADQWEYDMQPGAYQYEFWGRSMTAPLFGWTAALASVSALVGLWWGNWMAHVRR